MLVTDIVSRWQQLPFKRGATDCCAFCDYVVKETTGQSLLPQYSTDEQAESIISQHGSLSGAVSYYLGKGLVDVKLLKPGDIMLLDWKGHESIGVLMENGRVAIVFEDSGLREIHIGMIDEGWQVGRC